MTEQEIIEKQQATGISYLMRVGLFFHAYNGAAFALARLTGYQVRRVHRRQGDIFQAGFTANSFDKVRGQLADAGITLQGGGDLWWFEGGDGDTLRINHDCYGKYLFQFYYRLTAPERQALIHLDLMLDLIREDVASHNTVVLPDTLNTPEANMLLEKAQQVGYLDNRYQPTISNTKSALLAFEIAIRLDIKDKWKTFETFWHRKNMRSYYNNALLQRQSLKFQDEIKQLFK